MERNALTQTQRNEIYQLYVDGTPIAEIAAAYGINGSTVSKTAKLLGAKPRINKLTYAGKPIGTPSEITASRKYKVCGKCKKHIEVKGAMFCPYCGNDIRTPRDLLIARVASAMTVTKYLPEDMRDTMQKLLIDVKNELSKGI